ncbi:hypothetical protein OK351_11530 [Glutamicibacter sp. MNS18]|uniref:trypco2 family protein n=1 Tax=Glutamicibacter sp. MNS18 TaxID=2989817 RepID=UPI002236A451|nr:trypco2 family protein [Glutamicibacter sp. MNS18]MCW4466129.1 hypothetical protein [Glutamicibacter sp. MNS18]
MSEKSDETKIGLRQAIEQVRRELNDAQSTDPSPSGIRFLIDEVEIQFVVEIVHDESVNAGLKFYVFNAGASDSVKTGETTTVTINMKPQFLGSDGELGDFLVKKPVDTRPPTGRSREQSAG